MTMNTLENLRTGKLVGSTRLSISSDLKIFPPEIFDLADTLEILNLSNNKLSMLPDDLGRLKKLRILFYRKMNLKRSPKF
jgi:Leucine-rich repeat (LRR) protein